jgi:hypothetical protein
LRPGWEARTIDGMPERAVDAEGKGRKRKAPVPNATERTAEPHVLGLQRTIGNRATTLLLRQPRTRERPRGVAQPERAPTPVVQPAQQARQRPDFVFIMGPLESRRARNQFYRSALRYWRAHCPNATFVTDQRSMHDLLSWLRNNVHEPIGRLIIVSHANEDGTLSFGLDSADPNRRLDVRELDRALHPRIGTTTLPRLTNQIDGNTRIHIKGCDIGRTREMVELVDEAFGGVGVVTAPTHEQEYGYDPELARRAGAAARAEIEARHPLPPPVDSALRGRERTRAQRERTRALRERQRAITAELQTVMERGGTYEAFSGPMFQRPGSQLFTEAELEAEVDRLYGHLSDEQRARMVDQLRAADRRRSGVAHDQGTYQQQGQRAYRYTFNSVTFQEPQTAAQAAAFYRASFRREGFTPTAVRSTRVPVQGGFRVDVQVDGIVRRRGHEPFETTIPINYDDTMPDDATMIRESRELVPNPDRYRWTVEETRTRGRTRRVVVAERVVAYLHHGELDPAPHEHFTRPLTDPNFFTTSTFRPRAPRRP